MLVKEIDFDDDMQEVIDAHQSEYRRGKGIWQRVEYTDDVFILVRKKRARKADKYRIFLVEHKTQRFVSVMMLDPETINFKDRQIFYTPTSYIIPEYRSRGLFSPLYRWVLNHGLSLKADIRQSEHSNRLWHRLINEYGYITICDSKTVGDSYPRMLDIERLRLKHYTTLLFCNDWTEQMIKDFAHKITREPNENSSEFISTSSNNAISSKANGVNAAGC